VALKHLRAVAKGDTVAVYHTGDEKRWSVRGRGLDPIRIKLGDPEAVVVVWQRGKLETPVPLSTFRTDAGAQTCDLPLPPRLSVIS
jgi:hypothetical protein